ncbi:hypothetical protein [Flavihumibacter petaseus]|uniref:HMA domain-containing protein n=1 Tax=Flavihumibacter petaseus NBRC 106054 TaxID=1220578 RepID=A0A0E9MUF4_9BACT|nr:hypothetical protein [Flavihumibacter petaseus]GAO41051.1 hypothetical protein FPE01S_01_00630 [Flavihumibacter petaseus NBRC 106054]
MVEVFKTNVQENFNAEYLLHHLRQKFPECRINFDLDDCDRILRLEGPSVCSVTVAELLGIHGFTCAILD